MSDEPILEDLPTEDANRSPDKWVMPEPIFRTSDGYDPKDAKSKFYADDIPTEIANRDESEFAEAQPDTSNENSDAEDDEVNTAQIGEESEPNPKPKRGSPKSFLFIVSLIGVAAAAIILVLIYLLFYYSPAETGTF